MNLKPKTDFTRNVLTLMTGTTIAQTIPIAISPILTRLYSPQDFGVFALFIAISAIFSSIATGRYEYAIMLPKKNDQAVNIFALGLIITSTISLTLLILILIFHSYLIILLGNSNIGLWLYFIPFTVFFTGLYNLLNYYNNRLKQYKILANATIIKSIATAVIQLIIGFLYEGVVGLISGQLLSQVFANGKLLKTIIKDKIIVSKIKILVLAKKYKDFPKFSMWSNLINTSSVHLTNILISLFYSLSTLGLYSLVQRVLGLPTSLIGHAMGQVFFQEAVNEKLHTGGCIKTFQATIKKLILIAIPSFTIFYYIIEDIFELVFGSEWRIAGTYAQILIPLYFANFISSPLAIITSVFQKQKVSLLINSILISTSTSIIYLSHIYGFTFINTLFYLSYAMMINYFLFIIYYNVLSKGNV